MKTIFSALIVSALLLPLATAGQGSIKAGGAYQGDQARRRLRSAARSG